MRRRIGVAEASGADEPPGVMPAIGFAESTESPPSLTVVPDGVGGAPVSAPDGIGASEALAVLASVAGIDEGEAATSADEDDAAGVADAIVAVDEGATSVEVAEVLSKSCWTGTGGA